MLYLQQHLDTHKHTLMYKYLSIFALMYIHTPIYGPESCMTASLAFRALFTYICIHMCLYLWILYYL
ncbi:hypothetical protein EDC96DRAFT_533185 [Choanephora cucurbitarum]|nr:hypothetical protein EDC96DRAFT_533185 [Choanephora cucurbitarum]